MRGDFRATLNYCYYNKTIEAAEDDDISDITTNVTNPQQLPDDILTQTMGVTIIKMIGSEFISRTGQVTSLTSKHRRKTTAVNEAHSYYDQHS